MQDSRTRQGNVAVVVLAGGQGRRIGGGKPLRLLGGERLVDRALAMARRYSGHVALSVGSEDRLRDCDAPQIVDPQPDWGALGGLAAGLDFAIGEGLDLLLTLPCDSPFLPEDLLTRLGAALHSDHHGAAIPRSKDQLHVACGLWRVEVRALLAEYADGGGRSLHGLAERAGFIEVAWGAEPFDRFFNINTQEDLERAEMLLATSQPRP